MELSQQSTPQPNNVQMPQVPQQGQPSRKLELLILGFGELILPSFGLYVLIPLISIQQALDNNLIAPYLGVIFFCIVILVALVQICVGLFSLEKKLGDKKTWRLILAGLIITGLNLPAFIYFIIYPTYININSVTN